MQLTVKGKQLDVGNALRDHVEASLTRILGKYFGDAIEASVTFAREAHGFRTQVSAHVGRNILLEAHGQAEDPYPAFDQASERLSKRLRRHKGRLRNHHKQDQAEQEALTAQQYILAALDDEGEEGSGNRGEDQDQPIVVAEMTTDVPSLTVSEAVMRMDLADSSALMFRNSAHGGLNMVYRRQDGNIGWLDPRGNRRA